MSFQENITCERHRDEAGQPPAGVLTGLALLSIGTFSPGMSIVCNGSCVLPFIARLLPNWSLQRSADGAIRVEQSSFPAKRGRIGVARFLRAIPVVTDHLPALLTLGRTVLLPCHGLSRPSSCRCA